MKHSTHDKTRGISNEMTGDTASVSIGSGLLLIVHRRQSQIQNPKSKGSYEKTNSTSHSPALACGASVFLLTSHCMCSQGNRQAPQSTEPQTLTVLTHDSFAVSEDVVKAFEQANNAKVVFLKSGDAGAALNKVILTKDAPLADVLYGVDNTFLSRALEADIYEPYVSPALKDIPDDFKLDSIQPRSCPWIMVMYVSITIRLTLQIRTWLCRKVLKI